MSETDLDNLEASLADTTADAVVQGFAGKMGGAPGLAEELHIIYKSADNRTKLRILEMTTKTLAKLDAGKMKRGVQPQVLVLVQAIRKAAGPDSPMLPLLERAALSLGGSPNGD